jgi:hypothetical protein
VGLFPIDCFVCRPSPPPPEVPFDWLPPRQTCWEHRKDVTLEDGQPLRAVLDRARPPDQPLEGGLLATIYNPVFVGVPGGPATKGWTDWAGGGMGILEDRFLPRDHFEFYALAFPAAVDLLYAIRLAGAGQAPLRTRLDLPRVLMAAPGPPPRASGTRGPSFGWTLLVNSWNRAMCLRRTRAEAGRLWPESWEELLSWLEGFPPSPAQSREIGLVDLEGPCLETSTEPVLLKSLDDLARRRFPDLPGRPRS